MGSTVQEVSERHRSVDVDGAVYGDHEIGWRPTMWFILTYIDCQDTHITYWLENKITADVAVIERAGNNDRDKEESEANLLRWQV